MSSPMQRLLIGLGVILAVLLEASFLGGFGGRAGFPLHPLLLVAIGLTVSRRWTLSLIIVAAGGILADALGAAPIGVTFLRLLLAAFTARVLLEGLIPHRSFPSLLLAVIASVLVFRLSGILIGALTGHSLEAASMVRYSVFEILLNVLAVSLAYPILRLVQAKPGRLAAIRPVIR